MLPPQSAVISSRVAAGIAGGAELMPPAPDALDGEDCRVVIDAEIDPSGIVSDVVDAVWHRLAEFGDDEVMHPDRLGLTLGSQLPAAILEVPDKLLLLGVDRDGRLTGSLEGRHVGVDVLELGVAVGVAGAFARLAIGLQAEAQPAQQAANQLLAGGEALLRQRRRQMPLALADPQQGQPRDRHGSPTAPTSFRASNSPGWVSIAGLPPPPARRTRLPDHHGARPQVGQATTDRAARDAGRPRHRCHTTTSGRTRFTRGEQPALSLVQERRKRIEAGLDRSDIDHQSG